MPIIIKELSRIPQIDTNAIQGQSLCASTFYTDGQWSMWIDIAGELHRIQVVGVAEGLYFGDAAHSPHDLHLVAIDILAQHAFWGSTQKPFFGICDDIYNIAASIAKLDLITEAEVRIGIQATRMVITEVEYLAIQCRSIFDYVQMILKAQWASVYSLQDGAKPKCELPKSFSDMVLRNGKPRTADDIAEKHKIHIGLASAYARHAEFFGAIRAMRDGIIHSATSTKGVFTTETGPFIDASIWPFCTFTAWRPDEFRPNNLAPLMPALGQMLLRTLLAAEDLISVFAQIVRLGPPVCPGHRLYLRASSAKEIAALFSDAVFRAGGHPHQGWSNGEGR